jgi:hypothetical protein
MAVWQVEFAVVPRAALATASRAALAEAADIEWWTSATLPPDFARQLAAIAPTTPASAEELQTFGPADGNRIEVWSQNGRATRVTARVDVRRLDSKFGAMLLQFARVANAVLVRDDGLIIEPLVGAFAAALRSTDAWRYASDPAAYLASRDDDDEDDED